jgi:Holliday junction resolvase RusA-like endonuclease
VSAQRPDGGHPGLWVYVAGVPRAQPRGRHVGGHVVSTTGPAKIWRGLVKTAVLAAMERATADGGCFPIAGPVQLAIAVRFPTGHAERWGQWRTAVRDRDFDNVSKVAGDLLTDCGALIDDGQVARAVFGGYGLLLELAQLLAGGELLFMLRGLGAGCAEPLE